MTDLSFLRRIDLRELDTLVVEEDLHLIEEKLVRVGIRNIEPKVIYQLLLFLLPFGPTVLADLRADFLPEFGGNRRVPQRFVLLPATRAFKAV